MAIFNALLNLRELKELYSGKPVCVCPLYKGVIDDAKTFEATGNPIVLPEYKSLVNLKTTFSPKQAGTGDPSPENVRPITGYDSLSVNVRGKNLLDYTGEIVIPQNEYAFSITDKEIGSAIKQLPRDIQLVMTANWSYYTVYSAYKSIILYEKGITNPIRFENGEPNTIPKNYKINSIIIYAGQKKTQDCIVSSIQFEAGSTPTPYEPYKGNDYTLTLPESIYGGTVDAVTGAGSKTWGYIASYNREALPGEWISDRDVYSAGTTPTAGAQVAYKLATPEPFKISQVSIPSLKGKNTFFTNGENMDIIYKKEFFWSDEA